MDGVRGVPVDEVVDGPAAQKRDDENGEPVLSAEQGAGGVAPRGCAEAGGDRLDEERQDDGGEDDPEEELGEVGLPGIEALVGEGVAPVWAEPGVPVAGALAAVVVEMGDGGRCLIGVTANATIAFFSR